MERIHENVVVATTQCALSADDDGDDHRAPRTTALLFTVINTGFDAVAFSADFRASSNIRLRLSQPAAAAASGSRAGEADDLALLQFACHVAPLERRTLVHVLRVPDKRAFVRVQFALEHASPPTVHELELAQQQDRQAAAQATRRAQDKYYYANSSSSSLAIQQLSNTPQWIVQRCCDDINRFFHASGDGDEVRFVDTGFPPTRASLLGLHSEEQGNGDGAGDALYSLCSWKHLHDVMDSSWTFLRKDKRESQLQSPPPSPQGWPRSRLPRLTEFTSALPGQDSLLCAVAFLSLEKEEWVTRLFGDQVLDSGSETIRELVAISVQICDRGSQWRQIVVDLYQPAFPVGNGLMAICTPVSGEVYAMVVQKAYAKLRGSYAAIREIPTISILRELTGLPCRQQRRSHQKQRGSRSSRQSAAFVASFGKIGARHCAFPVLVGDDSHGITLQDVDGKVRKALGSSSKATPAPGSTDGERLVVACEWADFFRLEPKVWMLFANHSASKRKRIKFTGTRGVTRVQFAFSVAEMTSLVIATQLQGGERGSSEMRHRLALDVVDSDFSLRRIPSEAASELVDESELQLVVALGAGEYVLSVHIDTTKPPVSDNSSPDQDVETHGLLTSQGTAEKNLQVLFECIDQDMDGVISVEELQAFLRAHEDADGLHATSLETLFLDRFGSLDSSKRSSNTGKELLVDDLRDVYHFLAAADDRDAAADPVRQSRLQRYEELIWSDLNLVLNSSSSDGIRINNIAELRCCVHSDTPLVNLVQLAAPL